MHTPFGSALGFIPDKMLDQYQIQAYTRPNVSPQIQAQYQTRPHHPSPTTLLSSTSQCQNHSTQEALPSLISSFQPSLAPSSSLPLVAIVPSFSSLPFQHLRLHSPNLHFASYVPAFLDSGGTAPLLPYSHLTSSPPFHAGIRSLEVLSLEATICPS